MAEHECTGYGCHICEDQMVSEIDALRSSLRAAEERAEAAERRVAALTTPEDPDAPSWRDAALAQSEANGSLSKRLAALEQEVENYRGTVEALEAEIRRLRAERDEAEADVLSTFSDWVRALGLLARERRRASRYRSRLARVLFYVSPAEGEAVLVRQRGRVWSRRALDKKGETK